MLKRGLSGRSLGSDTKGEGDDGLGLVSLTKIVNLSREMIFVNGISHRTGYPEYKAGERRQISRREVGNLLCTNTMAKIARAMATIHHHIAV